MSFDLSWSSLRSFRLIDTYNGGDSELVLTSVLEEAEDIVTDDDTGLADEYFLDTHICCLCNVLGLMNCSEK